MKNDFLVDYELKFIDKLLAKNIYEEKAYTCIIIYFRNIMRPVDEVPAIISRFSSKLEINKIRQALEELEKDQFIKKQDVERLTVYTIEDNFADNLEKLTNINELAKELKEKKTSSESKLTDSKFELISKGIVLGNDNYQSLLIKLGQASHIICGAMLCSQVYDSTAKILKEMAGRGVKVRLLVGSDKIVKKIRGNSIKGTYNEWKKYFENDKNIEVRQFYTTSAAELCSSYIIDDNLLRLVVFDYANMPSLDGHLLEVTQYNGIKINLVEWYKNKFNSEWIRAKKDNKPIVQKIIFSRYTFSILIFFILWIITVKCELEGIIYDIVLLIMGICVGYFIEHSISWISMAKNNISISFDKKD